MTNQETHHREIQAILADAQAKIQALGMSCFVGPVGVLAPGEVNGPLFAQQLLVADSKAGLTKFLAAQMATDDLLLLSGGKERYDAHLQLLEGGSWPSETKTLPAQHGSSEP